MAADRSGFLLVVGFQATVTLLVGGAFESMVSQRAFLVLVAWLVIV